MVRGASTDHEPRRQPDPYRDRDMERQASWPDTERGGGRGVCSTDDEPRITRRNATTPKNENACTCPSTHASAVAAGLRPNVRRVALRQVESEVMDLALDPADERPRFVEITLPMPRRMNQRHVHLPAPAMMFAHVVLHDRVPTGEAVLVAKTLEDALRGVPLLAMLVLAIPPQPLVDESGEPIELRTARRRRASVPRRIGEREHLPHALA